MKKIKKCYNFQILTGLICPIWEEEDIINGCKYFLEMGEA